MCMAYCFHLLSFKKLRCEHEGTLGFLSFQVFRRYGAGMDFCNSVKSLDLQIKIEESRGPESEVHKILRHSRCTNEQ